MCSPRTQAAPKENEEEAEARRPSSWFLNFQSENSSISLPGERNQMCYIFPFAMETRCWETRRVLSIVAHFCSLLSVLQY